VLTRFAYKVSKLFAPSKIFRLSRVPSYLCSHKMQLWAIFLLHFSSFCRHA
jgi:hypothetical protein